MTKSIKSVQGKAESMVWKRNASLKDLLNLLDAIEADTTKTPEERAKLVQRVIDYGQSLSEAIYKGERKVPESDDNETIRSFNVRMQSTYITKGESSYEEARRPIGYYDRNGTLIHDTDTSPRVGMRGNKNPRWHPIPLKEEPVVIPEPITRNDDTIVPVTPPTRDDVAVVPPVTPPTRDDVAVVPPVTPPTRDDVAVIPPVTPVQGAGITENAAPTEATPTTEQPKKDKERRRRGIPAWLKYAPIAGLAGLLAIKDAKPGYTPENDKDKDKTEVVSKTPVMTTEESEYMRYTIEKGQRMMAKQHNVSVEEGARLYNEFVENIREGNIPEEMKAMTEEYNMSRMVDNELNLDLDNPEIAATTWLLMSESYPAISPIVQNAAEKPQQTTEKQQKAAEKQQQHLSQADTVRLKKYLKMANAAAQKHQANPESNGVSTVDYGLHGASVKTGWAISFRQGKDGKTDKADKEAYGGIAHQALQSGHEY